MSFDSQRFNSLMWHLLIAYMGTITTLLIVTGLLGKLNDDRKSLDVFWLVVNDLLSLAVTMPVQVIIVYFGYRASQTFLREAMHVKTPVGYIARSSSILPPDDSDYVWIKPLAVIYSFAMFIIILVTGVMKKRNKIAASIFWKIIGDFRAVATQLPAQMCIAYFGYRIFKHFVHSNQDGYRYMYMNSTNDTNDRNIELQAPDVNILK
jgi:hypothetical protein